jgi:hypothetical protein
MAAGAPADAHEAKPGRFALSSRNTGRTSTCAEPSSPSWNQIMGADDITADPATRTTADLPTSEILLQANAPL